MGSLCVTAVLSCVVALSATTVSAPVRLLTDALIMGGTTQSTPGHGFIDAVIRDFINPARPDTYVGTALTTPEQIVGINNSVSRGADLALAAIDQHETDHPGEAFVVFGFSQSTMVIMEVKARLAARAAAGESVPNVTFIGIGGGDWGSSITSRIAGVVIPVIDFTFRRPEPDVQPVDSIQIARQYDIFADTVQFVTNPVALANSLLGIFVHLDYANAVSLDPQSPNYVAGTTAIEDGRTTYYWIPTPDLPLFAPLRLAGMPEPVIDIFEPFFKVLVEAGYDRTVPFDKATPFQLIPTIDPITLGIQLLAATLEGANNAVKLAGGSLPGYAPLKTLLDSAAGSSAAAAAPYRDAVRAINEAIDPIAPIVAVEAPIATSINRVTNALGIPEIANLIIDNTVFPLSAWTFDNVFAPEEGAQLDPLARIGRQFIDRLTPSHAADESAATTTALSSNTPSADEQEQDGDTEGTPDPPMRRKHDPGAEKAGDETQTPAESAAGSAPRPDDESSDDAPKSQAERPTTKTADKRHDPSAAERTQGEAASPAA